jgi:hypothetical protein
VLNALITGMEKISLFHHAFKAQSMGKFRVCAAVLANPIVFYKKTGCDQAFIPTKNGSD